MGRMAFHNEHHKSIRRYLLGDLSTEELEQVEQLVMSDDNAYEELLFAEDDLIDEYVAGRLSEEDRTKFKQKFLAVPELRQSVGFASALKKHALKTEPQVVVEERVSPAPTLFERLRGFFMQPAFAGSFAAILVAALALNLWLFRQNSQLKTKVEQLEAQTTTNAKELQEQLAVARQRNEQLSADLLRQQQLLAEELGRQEQQKPPTRETNGTGVLALTLSSGFVRDSGEWTKFSLSPDKKEVSFGLDVAEGNFRTYQANLETIEGQSKLLRKNLRIRRANLVTFNVPANLLTPGDYRIVLSGVNSSGASTEVSSYYFRVLK